MQINHNISAMVTQHALYQNNNAMSKSLEKLSTGLRINRAQDDAAGLAMSEQMRSQIRGLGKAKQNALDGISALQIAEGALAEITNMMQRQKELAVQAANDTLTSTERMYLDDEFQALTKEIDRIAKTTDYNGKNVLIFNQNPNLSFGATKLNPYSRDVSFLEASKVLYDAVGAKLTGGFPIIGKTGIDGNEYTTYSTTAAGVGAANYAISQVNKIIEEASLIGLSEGNIKEILQKILVNGNIEVDTGISLGGASIFADPRYIHSADGLLLTDFDRQTVKEFNAFLRDISDAYDSLLEADVGDSKFGRDDITKAAMHTMADALDRLANSDNEHIITPPGDLTNLVYMSKPPAGNYTMLADAVNRIIDLISGVSYTDFSLNAFPTPSTLATIDSSAIAKLGSIFSRTAQPSIKEAVETLLSFDLSKMSDGEFVLSKANYVPTLETVNVADYEIAMALQKVVGQLQEAYNNYSDEVSYPVGTAASDILHISANYSKSLGGKDASEIKVNYVAIDVRGLGMHCQSITEQAGATRSIDRVDDVLKIISGNRASIGTYINRLDYTINNIASMTYNTQEAESRIRDTDFSKETTEFTKNQILVQSATSILAQANTRPQAVLGLLG
jgi:flagellin-like hook-associated protein FlgL